MDRIRFPGLVIASRRTLVRFGGNRYETDPSRLILGDPVRNVEAARMARPVRLRLDSLVQITQSDASGFVEYLRATGQRASVVPLAVDIDDLRYEVDPESFRARIADHDPIAPRCLTEIKASLRAEKREGTVPFFHLVAEHDPEGRSANAAILGHCGHECDLCNPGTRPGSTCPSKTTTAPSGPSS